MMNEKPILFSGEMVKAILEGRKTQTRRVIKPRGVSDDVAQWLHTMAKGVDMPCPYGQPGDRLWVRETFAVEQDERVVWKADRCAQYFGSGAVPNGDRFYLPSAYEPSRWKPSIFMPRWASRITLDVVRVRVERVQDITRDDAKAEGVSNIWSYDGSKDRKYFKRSVLNPYVANYSVLWDEINDKRGFGWDANPWVWVVEFKVV